MNSPATGHDADAGERMFATTRWSVVLAAQGRSAAADAALETLCQTYWLPLYAFIRREGYEMEEAEDLTQEFFARLAGAARFRCSAKGEREVAFLFARLAETLFSRMSETGQRRSSEAAVERANFARRNTQTAPTLRAGAGRKL